MAGRTLDDDKRLAAQAAIEEVGHGMLVGLGTGTTAAHAIELLGEKVAGGLSITAVATSLATENLARSVGIDILDFAGVSDVDLTIDGADEIDEAFRAIKGGGGAMVREKIVAAASRRMVVIADGSKRVRQLGRAPLPVEVLPFALESVRAALGRRDDAAITLRISDGVPFLSDNGNPILDCRFDDGIEDWEALSTWLDALPGIVGHGLFLTEIDAMYVASKNVVSRLERFPRAD